MSYFPCKDWVVVRRAAAELKVGTIIMPESSQPKNRAIIVELGPDVKGTLKAGDKVVINKAIELDKDLLLVREEEILCVQVD
jgi:co-chaperonin GroES (HSP10)